MYNFRIPFIRYLTFCTSRVTIPELQQGNKFCQEGRYTLAEIRYSRVIQIMNCIKFNQQSKQEYWEAVAKLAACLFINGKYQLSVNTLSLIDGTQLDYSFDRYFLFLRLANLHFVGSQLKGNEEEKDIKQIVEKLLSRTEKDQISSSKFPILSNISNHLNNCLDYRNLLTSLIDKSTKTPNSELPVQQLIIATNPQISTQLQLLSLMGYNLQNRSLTSADKYHINNTTNTILKQYQQHRPQQLYKPLLIILMSLIVQKHYMSAQGIIGFILTQGSNLISTYKSNDRMLVNRANNQNLEDGFGKEQPVALGDLVVERIVKAPLMGHSISNLIC